MKLYTIRDWSTIYENNRSRVIRDLRWVPLPNRMDGENFCAIMNHPRGAEIFSAFVLMVEIASTCSPRGTLIRGNGIPHTAHTLANRCRCRVAWFEIGLHFLENETDWLVVTDITPERHPPDVANVTSTTPERQLPVTEERQRKKEGNEGMKELLSDSAPPPSDDRPVSWKDVRVQTQSRVILHFMNERAGRHFRETEDNLKLIGLRLLEVNMDTDGVRVMLTRQVTRWHGDPKMEEYLRPMTLFAKTNFHNYYDNRTLPMTDANGRPARNNADREVSTLARQAEAL